MVSMHHILSALCNYIQSVRNDLALRPKQSGLQAIYGREVVKCNCITNPIMLNSLQSNACSTPRLCQVVVMLEINAPGAPCAYNSTCTSTLSDNTVGKCASEDLLPSSGDCTAIGNVCHFTAPVLWSFKINGLLSHSNTPSRCLGLIHAMQCIARLPYYKVQSSAILHCGNAVPCHCMRDDDDDDSVQISSVSSWVSVCRHILLVRHNLRAQFRK